jgi:hypothetical protein
MNTWKHLPTEILHLIFDEIIIRNSNVRKDLCQCQLICKNWSETAQRYLYKSIFIRKHEILIKLLASLCSSKSNPARFTKNITITLYNHELSYMELFHLLLLKCPNVERIHDHSSAYYSRFFEEIQLASERGACKRIQYVSAGQKHTLRDQQIYLDTMYCLRNSLLDLFLADDFKPLSSATYSPLQILNEFPALRTLKIRINYIESFYFLGKCIESCRNLETLELYWDSNINTDDSMIEDVRSLTGCPTVKRLCIFGLSITKKILEFVIHAFPNLNTLTLNISKTRQNTNNMASNNLWVQFLAFLHNIKGKIAIKNLYIADIPGVLIGYCNTRKTNINLYIFLKNDLEQSCVDITNDEEQTDDQAISIQVQFHAIQDKSAMLTLLCGAGSFLKSLTFDNGDPEDGDSDDGDPEDGDSDDGDPEDGDSDDGDSEDSEFNFSGSIWDAICRQCPSLENLDVSTTAINNSGSQLQTNTSIRNVMVGFCDISQELFPELSIHLTSLSNLCLLDCKLLDDDGIYSKDHHYILIEMPNTTFDTLTWTWDTDEIFRGPKFNNIVFRVDTSSKTYCCIGNEDGSIDELSGASFQKSWDDNTILSFYIQCHDIKKFDVTHDNYSWNIVFTEL